MSEPQHPHSLLPPSDDDQLVRLIEDCLDGDATPQQQQQLHDWISSDPAASERYLHCIHDVIHLQQWAIANSTRSASQEGHSESSPPASARRLHHGWFFWARPTPLSLTIAALAIALMITAMAFMVAPFYRSISGGGSTEGPTAERTIAQITRIHQTEWTPGSRRMHAGDKLTTGQPLRLQAGLMEIRFHGGAVVIVEGPSDFVVTGAKAGRLEQGKLVAHVPPQAAGFAIETPQARFVDLGTEFGVTATADRFSEASVLEGIVEIQTRNAAGEWVALRRLSAGVAVRVDARAQVTEVAQLDAVRLTRTMPPRALQLGSTVVERPIVDSAHGVTLIYGGTLAEDGTADVFEFFSEESGRWVTPLIFAWDARSSQYFITGIGQSIQSDGSGGQSHKFVTVAGSPQLQASVHTFGFFGGRVATDGREVIQTTALNAGVITAEMGNGGPWMFAFREHPRQVQLGRTYALGLGAEEQLTLGRTYSARLLVRPTAQTAAGQ